MVCRTPFRRDMRPSYALTRSAGLAGSIHRLEATMRDATARRLSRLHVLVYRLTGGRIGRRLVNNDMLLLTTCGARTGRKHTVPLLYLRDGETLVVIASWGGRPKNPHWFTNL